MKKQHIFSAIVLILIAGLGGMKYYNYKHPSTEINSVVSPVTGNTTADNVSAPGTTTSSSSSANIVTDAPVNGTYKGVIEVGASGFNAFVVNIDQDKNWELVSKDFGASLAYEGFATVDDVYPQMLKYISIITDKGVAGRNVHFVISSGALKNPKIELIAQAIQKKGFTVNRVTAEQESKYALKALLSKRYRDNSYIVDIGSGNTKMAWYDNGVVKYAAETPGAKYYQDGKSDADVYQLIKNAVTTVPQANRTNLFIIGGVPFKLAKESRNGDERFTLLKNPDEYSAGDDVKLKSGLNIYRAVYENSGTTNVIFDWDANFTIGFLLTLN